MRKAGTLISDRGVYVWGVGSQRSRAALKNVIQITLAGWPGSIAPRGAFDRHWPQSTLPYAYCATNTTTQHVIRITR